MIVHKFGGASIKDAQSIKNLALIVKENIYAGDVIVLSAMGKTTNALEDVTTAAFAKDKAWKTMLKKVEESHIIICKELFGDNSDAGKEIQKIFSTLEIFILNQIETGYNKFYDAVVSKGEKASTAIVFHFLNNNDVPIERIMAPNVIITDNSHREARVLWEESYTQLHKSCSNNNLIHLTQGFIAATKDGVATTLGREGSDFSAAIIANIFDAKEVRIWKDVDGLFNADPKIFNNAVLLPRVSYRECVELGYYGARVIHPRTILPLLRKNIPLYIQSFWNKGSTGTIICSHNTEPIKIPCYIIKDNQCLMTISPVNLGFMAEEYVERIIGIFKTHGIRINLMQSSAVNLTLCFDYDSHRFSPMLNSLESDFELRYNNGLSLLTISNYSDGCINEYTEGKKILLTQRSRKIIRFVYQ